MKHKIRKLAAVFLALCLVVQTLVPSVFAMDNGGSERIENTDSRVVLVQNEGEDWPLWETMSYTRQPGATAEVSFEGTGLALYGQKAANGPILSVTIDGVPMEDADFYAPSTTGSEELVWQVEGLEDGAHQAVFTFTDRANPSAAPIQGAMQAAIDYFVVTSEETQPELPAGQQSRVEDTDAAMSFDDTWAPYGNIHYTGTVGATMSFTFTGNAVELYGDVNYTGLTFDVSIDGQPAGTADTYAPSYAAETKIYSASGLQEGEHRLTLTYTGENNNPEAHGVLQGSVDYALVWAQEQPDLIRYEKDYEDGQPGEWEGARAEVVEDPDQPGNHVLKVSNFEAGEAGRYFARDASAPAIKDGTLSMRVKAEHPTSSVYFQFGFIYRAEDAVKEANQFTQSGAWYVCNEGSYNVGYPTYLPTLKTLPTNEWLDIKLQFNGDDVEIAVNGMRYGVFTQAGLSPNAGTYGFRNPGGATFYVDDLIFTEEMLDMGRDYEEPEVVLPRLEWSEDYAQDAADWTGNPVVEDGLAGFTIPANGVVLNNKEEVRAGGANTWRLRAGENGAFGVVFQATDEAYTALYTLGDGSYTLRFANGESTTVASDSLRFSAGDSVKVCVVQAGAECRVFLNDVEIGRAANPCPEQEGTLGLYNPTDSPLELAVSGSEFRELYWYSNDFSDAGNLGGWTGAQASQTEDGQLRLDISAVSNAIAMDTPLLVDGTYELDFCSMLPENQEDSDFGRVGFLFRADETGYQSVFYDTGSSWFWLCDTQYGGIAVSTALTPDTTVHVKLSVQGSNVSLELDGKQVFAGAVDMLGEAAGRFGIRKQWKPGVVLLDNLKITKNYEPAADDRPEQPVELTDGELSVTMDAAFPRVIEYRMDGGVLPGSVAKKYGVYLNGSRCVPLVSAEKTADDTLEYTLDFPLQQVKMTLRYQVKDGVLQMQMTALQEEGELLVETMRFENSALAATPAGDAAASHASVEAQGGWFQVTDHIYDTAEQFPGAMQASRGYAMLSGGGLAATINNNIFESAQKLTVGFEETEAGTQGWIGDGTFTLRTPLDLQEENEPELPWSKVAVCADYNGSGAVDWQDAAANHRNIRTEIYGMDTMKDNMMYITMNFASQVQQPFLRTLDLAKTIYNYTDGFGQMVMHKGFAAEGHDDSHADYGGHVGVRQGGAEDFNAIIEEGKDYNVKFGVHINVSEHNPDAFYFNEDVMTRPLSANWGWIDQAYWVDETKDILSGNRAENLRRLKETLPGLSFVYVDIYSGTTWMAQDLVENLNGLGLIAGTEFGGSLETGAAFTHWGRDRSYPNHGNNSTILRFVKPDVDVFVTNALFNTGIMPRVGSWGNQNNISEATQTSSTMCSPPNTCSTLK